MEGGKINYDNFEGHNDKGSVITDKSNDKMLETHVELDY